MPLLRYSLLRLAVLLGSFGLFWLVGLRSWPWLFASVVTAGAVSYLTMRTQRSAAVDSLASRAERADVPLQGDDEDAEDRALDSAAEAAEAVAAARAAAAVAESDSASGTTASGTTTGVEPGTDDARR